MKNLCIGLMMFVGVVAAASRQSVAVPRFEPGDCPFSAGAWTTAVRLECGTLVVAQDRRLPNGKTFRLAVALARSLKPPPDVPIVYLSGGPSGEGGVRSGFLEWFSQTSFNRDAIVYDYRGQGVSEPPLDAICSGLSVEACIPKLRVQGIDHTTFNSATNADDLRELRKALGYERWDLVGVSYGTRVAQEAMRRDPQGIRQVILTAPLPVGSHVEAELPRTFQNVMERVFASCAAQPACVAAYPRLEADFYAVYDELIAKPIQVSVPRAGEPLRVVFDGRRFVRALKQRFPTLVAEVPLIVHELVRGDRVGTARRLIGDGGPAYPNNTLTNLVGCYDRFGPQLKEMGAAVAASVRPPFRQLQVPAIESECEYRRDRPPDPGYDDLVASDIPTLIFGDEFDDRTPTELGRRIASRLDHAYVFEIPGVSHGVTPLNECVFAIAASFFANPLKAPDASCLAKMPKMIFSLPETGPLTLTFAIASEAESPFSGRWQAAFRAGGDYTFDLKIQGERVTGAIRTTGLTTPIQEGHAAGSEIRFSDTSPSGERIIRFVGVLDGARILFTRQVQLRPGGSPGGAALFGAGSGHWFTAVRTR